MPAIPTESVDCPAPPAGLMEADWNDLIWAAITVGRPNRYYIFKHGAASIYEIIFRTSLLRMAVVSSAGGSRFFRTPVMRSLDPSEKGAINYFLGLTLCKLYAEKQLGVPWLLHLDVFRDLNPVLRTSERSRPDLVGRRPDDTWVAFESKGRVAPADSKTKRKAKIQAGRVVSVLGRPVTGHFAGISYFKNETLSFYVQDPPPMDEGDAKAISLRGDSTEFYETYYAPFLEFIRSQDREQMKTGVIAAPSQLPEREGAYSAEMDVEIGMRSDLFRLAIGGRWDELAKVCHEERRGLVDSGFHSDGLMVRCGESWHERIKRSRNREVDDE